MPKNKIKNQEQALQAIVSLIKDNTSIRPSAYSVNGVDDRGELVLSLEDHDGNEFSISLGRSGYGTVIVFPNDFSDKNRSDFMFSVQGERQWRDYADNVYNEHLEEWDVQRKQPAGADIPDVMDGEEVNVNAIQNIDNFIRNNGVVGNEKGVALGDILSVSLKNGSSLQLADLHYPDGNVSTIYFMHDNEHNSQSFVYDKSKLVEGVKDIDGHHINEVAGMMSEAINTDREVSEAQAEPLNWDEKKYYTSSSFIGRTEDEMEHFDTMRTEKDVNSLLSYAKDYEASNSNKVNLGQTYSQPHLTKSDMVIAENDDYAVSYDPSDMPLAYVMYRKVSEGEIRDVIAESNARGYDNSYDSEVVRDIRSKMEREEKALEKQSFYAFMTDATPDFIDGISKDASANEIINSLVEASDAVDESNDVEKEGYLATDIHTEYGSSYAENSKYVIGFDPNDIEFGGNYNLYQKINGLEAKKILLAQGYKESEILNFFKNFLGNDSAFREAVSEGSEVSKNLDNAQSEKQESKQVKTYYAFLGEVDEDLLDTSLADSVNTQTIMGIAHGVIPDKTPITVPNVFVSPGDVFTEDKEYVLGFDVGDKADSYNFYRKLSEKDFMGLLLNHGYNEQEAKEYIKNLDLASKTHAKEVAGKKEENQKEQASEKSIKRPTFVKDLSPLEKNVYDLVSKPSSLNDVKVNHIDADKGTWYSFGDGTRDYDYFVADEKLRVNDILRVHDPKTGFSNQVLDASLAEWLSENIPNIRPVAKQEQQPIPREENHEQYISVGENKDSLSNLSTGGRWHNAVINELRVYQRYGEILTDWKNIKDNAPLKSSHYVPDNNPVKALVMSVWSSMHDYKHPVYLSAREVEQQGLMVRKGSLGIPVFDKGTSQIEDYYNIDQTNFKLLAEQSTVVKEKYDSILKDAADYLYQGRKYLRDVDNLANDGKWVVPVVKAADWEVAERFKYDNNSDAPSAIYDRDKDEIVVLKEDYDGSIPDSRTDEILGSLTDSLLVGDRISQKSAHDSNYYSFAKLMNFIRYDISMDYVKDKEIPFLTFSNRHNAEFNRFRDDPQYTKDVLETAARVSDTIFSKSQGMDITLDNQKAEAEQQSQQQSYGISEAKPEQEQEEIQHRGIHF